MPKFRFNLDTAIPLYVLAGLISSGVANFGFGKPDVAHWILFATLVVGALPLFYEVFDSIRRGHFGVDLIAIVAIAASLIFGQYLPGTVVLLMLSGGEALESYALRRARKELTDLASRAPEVAHKKEGDTIRDVPVREIVPSDIVLVKPGEMIPVDGEVTDGDASVDESALTGEAIPVRKAHGATVMSGSIDKDGVLTIRATRPSSESKFEQIIRLVQEAEQKKAPFVRLADRYSVWFTVIAFILAGLAWYLSHDPIRLLAVLVVATPCPLILATPIAFASGISVSAKRGIIIKNGGAIEKLGEAKSFVFDKTGTLTLGVPDVKTIEAYGTMKEDDVLSVASSLDQFSTHILAKALVQGARKKGVRLMYPDGFKETFGEGVEGNVDGKRYMLGKLSFLKNHGVPVSSEAMQHHEDIRNEGGVIVYLADASTVLGAIILSDTIRKNVRELFANLKNLGIERVTMLTGDKRNVALTVAKEIGLGEHDVKAEALPEDKVAEVERMKKELPPVVMVGDGVNDAPAITAADVGIAMGAHGSTASSEAGDVVMIVDQIERVGEALAIGHRVLAIAKQSIFIGIGLSILLMFIASLGYIPPVVGAMFQEVIDVVVILNALRVLLIKPPAETVLP